MLSSKISRLSQPLITRKVVGHSMHPTLQSGKIVWASPLVRPKLGSIVIAQHEGREIIKRIERIVGDTIHLQGDNHNDAHNARIDRRQLLGVVISS